jgi:hypothetical protein
MEGRPMVTMIDRCLLAREPPGLNWESAIAGTPNTFREDDFELEHTKSART